MADITITAADVAADAGATSERKNAAVAITAGQLLYIDANGDVDLAAADLTSIEATIFGIALDSAPGAGQPVFVMTSGTLDIGGTALEGKTFVASTTPGNIALDADITVSTHFKSVLGVGVGLDKIKLGILNSGGQIP